MKHRLEFGSWRRVAGAVILATFLTGLFGQPALALQDNDAEPQFMSHAAHLTKWRSDQAAMKALLLNALDDEKAFEKYSFDWYPGLLEPRHFLRIGIGVTYNDRGYDGELLALGSVPDQIATGMAGGGRDPEGFSSAQSGVARGGGDGGANAGEAVAESTRPANPQPGADPMVFLQKYGGSLAEDLVKRLNERVDGNRLGKVLNHLDGLTALVPEPEKSANDPATGVGDVARSSEGPGRGGGGGSEKGPQMVEGGTPTGLGSGGEVTTAPPANSAGATNEATEESAAAAAAAAAKKLAAVPENVEETYNTVIPGVVCLNEGKREELFQAAQEKGLDLLFIVDIKVQESRRVHFSTTNLRLFNVNSGNGSDKTIVQSKAIRHDIDLAEKDEKSGKNLVESELDKVFEEFDKQFVANPLPGGLKPEHVENRVNQLLAALNSGNRLRVAVEVVAFYRNGLLDPAKASEALDKIFNGGGQLLLNGAPQDRLAFLNKVLAESN